jgi:1,4-alpha-glucan branching enzyme
MPALSPDDLWLLNEGTHTRLYDRLGAHRQDDDTVAFGVWAPNAKRVSVFGDFNGWDPATAALEPQGDSGVWHGVAAGVADGSRYKYRIESKVDEFFADKSDPYAVYAEPSPATASKVWDLAYDWGDDEWMASRGAHNALDAPMSVYELHLGSWRHADHEHRSLNYREVAPVLAEHVVTMGFTHVELMPIMEYPFYGSWGYQTTGYFAPTSRFGTPQDFMYLVDVLHAHGIGVLLDWVPSHFPADAHSLGFFDGTHLYEHADPRQGLHPDWDSLIFNYDRHEVRSFLLSSAHSWLDRYHADGLRVDAVASMLYLDYSRNEGEWIPNEHGGNENLGALRFLKVLNETVYADFPDVQMVAEESTAWPMVSRPTSIGGLGFGLKWDMGWMHDTLAYFERDPIHRRHHQDELTFRMVYAFTENFCLPLSHDEVVHGKGALLSKMPGDRWQRLANLRALLGYQYAQPGKQLLFMGSELAAETEWNHDDELPWGLLADDGNRGVRDWITHLNHLHRSEPALHEVDFDAAGFEWVDAADTASSVLGFLRWPADRDHGRPVLVVANLTPVPRHPYVVGVPRGGRWDELANSDASAYSGSGWGNLGAVGATATTTHGRPFSVELTLPPLSIIFLAPAGSPP